MTVEPASGASDQKVPPDEGAPATETPEKPASVPEETPRDDQSPLETPESPRSKMRVTEDVGQVEALDEPIQELLHVSMSPVHSHAPVWLPREPNTP
jgi:hypothetical protein